MGAFSHHSLAQNNERQRLSKLARLSAEDQALVRLAMAHGLTFAEALDDLREAGAASRPRKRTH
jgi:hypothetical protein